SSRSRLPFEDGDRHVVVADSDSVFEFKFLAQTKHALKPERTSLRIAHGQTKMPDNAELKRYLHFHIPNKAPSCQKRTHPNMTALALILCAAIAAMGALIIFAPARANNVTRLFADKTGMWVAAGIRMVFGLGLLAAASESKAPILLRTLGLVIL